MGLCMMHCCWRLRRLSEGNRYRPSWLRRRGLLRGACHAWDIDSHVTLTHRHIPTCDADLSATYAHMYDHVRLRTIGCSSQICRRGVFATAMPRLCRARACLACAPQRAVGHLDSVWIAPISAAGLHTAVQAAAGSSIHYWTTVYWRTSRDVS